MQHFVLPCHFHFEKAEVIASEYSMKTCISDLAAGCHISSIVVCIMMYALCNARLYRLRKLWSSRTINAAFQAIMIKPVRRLLRNERAETNIFAWKDVQLHLRTCRYLLLMTWVMKELMGTSRNHISAWYVPWIPMDGKEVTTRARADAPQS